MTKYTKQLEDEFNKIVEEQFVKTKKELLQALKDATPEDTGEAREGWRLEGNTIVNDVDHVESLNRGTSQQAPSYFVERTLLSQKGVTPRGTIVRSR